MSKTTILCLSALVIAVSLFMSSSSTAKVVQNYSCDRIIIVQRPDEEEEAPRSANPFSAELEGMVVTLYSDSDWGVVYVTLVSSAGDNYSGQFDTSLGSLLIPISGLEGDYSLRIVTEGGLHYYGVFSLQED